jgi:outer membrane protein YopM
MENTSDQYYNPETKTMNLSGVIPKNTGEFKLSIPTDCECLHLDNNGLKQLSSNLPEGLKVLSASGNHITSIPELPEGLTHLVLSNNKITKVENIPKSCVYLDMRYNKVSSLDTAENNLKTLKLNFNSLITFKENSLPNSLEHLEVTNNNLTDVKNLPDSIKLLNLSNNSISKITQMPSNLEKLVLINNKILSLENVKYSEKLSEIEIEYNYLEKIPDGLPKSLKGLFLDHNKISVLNNCPEELETLSVDSNQVHTVEKLPENLLELHISNNQLTSLKNLPNTIEDLHAKNNLLRILKHIPKECGTLDVRNNLIETVKVTKCFKNLRDLSILGNNIKDVDTLVYKLNKLQVLSDIIPDEESSGSESEIDFENFSDNISIGSDIDPRLLDEDMMDNEGEVTSDDILNFTKKLKKNKLRTSVKVEDQNSQVKDKEQPKRSTQRVRNKSPTQRVRNKSPTQRVRNKSPTQPKSK